MDVWYPEPELGHYANTEVELPPPDAIPERLLPLVGRNPVSEVNVVAVRTTIADLTKAPRDAYEAYLRLHLLSHRMVRPHEANLVDVEELLADVVWTNHGPVAADDFPCASAPARIRAVHGHGGRQAATDDKPLSRRVCESPTVPAYNSAHTLAPGTTVMPGRTGRFSAGTLGGARWSEGEVAAGVVVGDGSDVGGGSGGHTISIGMRCLVGANAEVEISLGDDCVVETGLHVASDPAVQDRTISVAARTVDGMSNLHLRRNSITGAIEAWPWPGKGVDVNAELLAND